MSREGLPPVPIADLLAPSPDAYLVTDLTGQVVYLNPAAERLLEHRLDVLEGRDLGVLLADGEEVPELIGRWTASASLRPATLVLTDGRRLRCDGARLPRQPLVQLRLRDHAQALTAFQRINDQVETRSLRELSSRLDRSVTELRAANQRLEAANEEIRQYARAVAHDFRNPLVTIKGLAHLLGEELPVDSEGAHFIELILQACARLQATTEGVVSVARLERAVPEPSEVDTGAVVAEAVDDLAGEFEQVDAELAIAPLHPVVVDPTALRRVVQNLVANSLQYAPVPDRPLTIEVWSRRVGTMVELTVADDGTGIDAAERDRIFDLFHRGTGAAGTPGTGIGLTNCRKTVISWGGTITCRPRQGPGVQFVFTVPAAAGTPATPPTDGGPG